MNFFGIFSNFRFFNKNSLFFLCFFSLIFFGCSKKNSNDFPKNNQNEFVDSAKRVKSHSWFWFDNEGIHNAEKISDVPKKQSLPWTEAIRISSAGSVLTSDSSGEQNKGFCVVNRLGILMIDKNCDSGFELCRDSSLFENRTAGNLVFFNQTPLFSIYKSTFFNSSANDSFYRQNKNLHYFLVQFDSKSKISYPLVNSTSILDSLLNHDEFDFSSSCEVTDFYWNGKNEWLCSLKLTDEVKNEFLYVKWSPKIPLLSLSPSNAKNEILCEEISQDEFRNSRKNISYEQAPERVKKLLSGFDKSLNFLLSLKTDGGSSPRIYKNQVDSNKNSTESTELSASGIISSTWSAVLFQDGTFFIEGALPDKHIVRGGKPVAIRLPKLPAGFVYGEFVIVDSKLYASWEETDFYKTSRSGFVEISFDETLFLTDL